MRRRLGLALVAMSCAQAACDALPFFEKPKKKEKKKPAEDDEPAVAEATATAAVSSTAAPAATPKKPVVIYDSPEAPTRSDAGLMEKPDGLVRAINDELGESPRVLSVTIFYDYAVVETRDPDNPKRKRKFTHRGGALREWDSKVTIDHDPKRLERDEFALSEVDWKALPKATKDALTRFDAGPERLTHANVGRSNTAKGVEIHYHLKSDTRSGMVMYTAKGKFIELHKY